MITKKLFPFELTFKAIFRRVLCAWFLTAVIFLSLSPELVNDVAATGNISFLSFALCFVLFSALCLRFKSEIFASGCLFLVSTFYFIISAASGNDGWLAVGLCLAAGAVFTFCDELKLPDIVKTKKSLFVTAAVCFVSFTAVAGGIGCLYYQNHQTPNFDFGIFSQMFYYMKETGKQLVTSERDGLLSHFAVHFSPVFYLLLPFYYLIPTPQTLLVLQAAVVASGVFPLLLLCEKFSLSKKLSALVLILYSLYPAFWGGCFYYLHENCFLAPFLLWLFYFFEKENAVGIFSLAVLSLCVKEDAPVYVAVAALYFLVSKKDFLRGSVVFFLSVAWFVAVLSFLKNHGEGIMTYRYDNLIFGNGGLSTVIKTVFENPALAVRELFEKEKLLYFLEAMLPLFFLPLMIKNPERLFLLFPLLLVNLLPDYSYQHQMGYQYGFGSGAFLVYLAVLNLSALEKESTKERLSLLSLACAAIVLFSLFAGKFGYFATYINESSKRKTVDYALSLVEDNASVAASAFLLPNLSSRKILYELDTTEHRLECEYVVIDLTRKYKDDFFDEKFEIIFFRENLIAVLKRTVS